MTAVAVADELPAFLTIQEFAAVLRMSVRHIERQLADGELDYVKLGRAIRIPRSEVDRLLGEHRSEARRKGRKRRGGKPPDTLPGEDA